MTTWKVNEPYDKNVDYEFTIPDGIQKGQHIVIFSYDDIPVVTVPVTSTRKSSIMRTIYKAMYDPTSFQLGNRISHQYFDKDRRYPKVKVLYNAISDVLVPKFRMELVSKFESGNLKPYELLYDYMFIEGLRIGDDGFVHIVYGS